MVANDQLLEPLLRGDAESVDRAMEHLIVSVAEPVVASILVRMRARNLLGAADAEDVAATVRLRLLTRLRRIAAGEAIEDFRKYVVALTHNLLHDHLRVRFPERTRLKNRLRYVATYDPRLALWTSPAGVACGLAGWRGREPVAQEVPLDLARATAAMLDRGRTAGAVEAILTACDAPVTLDALVVFTAALWKIVDHPHVEMTDDARTVEASATAQLEDRQLLEQLWREVRELRPMQRKALLLNLRDDETVNVISLLTVTGVARFDDIAAALEMSVAELTALWNDLPLGDARIAEMLQITRQQVINLRKAARARLTRRVGRSS